MLDDRADPDDGRAPPAAFGEEPRELESGARLSPHAKLEGLEARRYLEALVETGWGRGRARTGTGETRYSVRPSAQSDASVTTAEPLVGPGQARPTPGRASSSKVPPSTMTPAIAVPWPPRYLVAGARRCPYRARAQQHRRGHGVVHTTGLRGMGDVRDRTQVRTVRPGCRGLEEDRGFPRRAEDQASTSRSTKVTSIPRSAKVSPAGRRCAVELVRGQTWWGRRRDKGEGDGSPPAPSPARARRPRPRGRSRGARARRWSGCRCGCRCCPGGTGRRSRGRRQLSKH